MAEQTAGQKPQTRSITGWIAGRYTALWRMIHRIQTARYTSILGWGEIAIGLVIALFPGRNVAAAADGKPGGLVIAGLLMVFFAICGGRLLFRTQISDREMKILLSPYFILWLITVLQAGGALLLGSVASGGTLIVCIIVTLVMLMGMSYTYDPYRERP